jgi:hypothetical protein
MDLTVKYTGVKEIDQVLKGMTAQLNHRVLQAAHASALKVTIDQAKLLAPEGPTGNTIDSLGVIKPSFARASDLGLVEGGPRRGKYKGNVAHLIEYGTKSRATKKGANRGTMPRRPFMGPAWERTKDRVLSSVNNLIGAKLLAFMKRTIKNG